MGRVHDTDYCIRVPLNMIQLTERDGRAWPLAFDWEEANGDVIRVEIDKVISVAPYAEQKSGAVGDRYECLIDGLIEYLFYSVLQPRKWFKLKEVGEAEYKQYYRIPGEQAAVDQNKRPGIERGRPSP